ncbi:c-di-GMP phosphodiesterase [Leptospira stimsonii]|uniref:C-di-GMP phosphodiesterase n=1 Tax=Leptospira stimsonii TaxID=2202203 RepID=A0A4V3JVB3_9LEPT|nr:c-di-GMP phosphodiesterase [Leptospira stimsonii]RHX87648.1 c-di-GMP phosphodiesterase [Leptospira stimsonii]TGK10995.1 c-di-GMP phosphodiesterase [Leptospira stimsonii]TGM18883.1 c-di-GMP phosphodiesterase [Leptospira stimsonii]
MDAQKDLQKFDFTEEIIQHFKINSVIPVDFYNRNGQILIHKKENANGDDITRLLKFESQGIYFLKSEFEKISGGKQASGPNSVNGREVSFTKLVNSELTVDLAKNAAEFLSELKKFPLNGGQVRQLNKSIDGILEDFRSTPDMENGLVNIIEVMSAAGVPMDSEVLTKRTVISMAMKVRAGKAFTKVDMEQKKIDQMNLMMSSYLADVGYTQMKIPIQKDLKTEEFEYIKNHPIISYLMVANMPDLDDNIKTLVLNHHRPHKGEGMNNNYPQPKILVQKLNLYKEKYKDDPKRTVLVADIQKQIRNILTNNLPMDDIGVISIAGEFASLTTRQEWRDAYDPLVAMKLILNNSFFAYNEKTLREFYDHIGLSLCNNQPFIREGDFVIVVTQDSNQKVFFEVCIIREMYKTLIRPMLERIGTIRPNFSNMGKLRISGFDLPSFKLDRRKAIFNLEKNQDPRRIIYVLDAEMDGYLYEELIKQTGEIPKESA